MPFIESLSTINSLIRTGLAVLAVGLLGAGGYYGYRTYNAGDLADPAGFHLVLVHLDRQSPHLLGRRPGNYAQHDAYRHHQIHPISHVAP